MLSILKSVWKYRKKNVQWDHNSLSFESHVTAQHTTGTFRHIVYSTKQSQYELPDIWWTKVACCYLLCWVGTSLSTMLRKMWRKQLCFVLQFPVNCSVIVLLYSTEIWRSRSNVILCKKLAKKRHTRATLLEHVWNRSFRQNDMAILKWHFRMLRLLSVVAIVTLESAASDFSYCSNDSVSCISQVHIIISRLLHYF